uniref:Uncharacterized protein n=1 Tax=Naja naja TaxID=35670 RepID=A0A8C6Y6D2_NAJNA
MQAPREIPCLPLHGKTSLHGTGPRCPKCCGGSLAALNEASLFDASLFPFPPAAKLAGKLSITRGSPTRLGQPRSKMKTLQGTETHRCRTEQGRSWFQARSRSRWIPRRLMIQSLPQGPFCSWKPCPAIGLPSWLLSQARRQAVKTLGPIPVTRIPALNHSLLRRRRKRRRKLRPGTPQSAGGAELLRRSSPPSNQGRGAAGDGQRWEGPPKEEPLLSQKREVGPQAPEEKGEGAAGQEGDREATGASQTVETDGYKAPTKPPGAELRREQPFQRAGSIRERARQFSSDSANAPSAPQKGEKAGRRLPALPPQHLPPSQHAANSPLRDRDGAAIRTLRAGSEAQDAARTVPSHSKAGPPSQAPSIPKEAGGPQGRFQGSQWQERKLAPTRSGVENSKGAPTDSEVLPGQQSSSAHGPAGSLVCPPAAHPDDEMKTLLTIEIKDSRHQPLRGHLAGPPGNQRAELTLGLRNSPLRITTSSHGGSSSSFEKAD